MTSVALLPEPDFTRLQMRRLRAAHDDLSRTLAGLAAVRDPMAAAELYEQLHERLVTLRGTCDEVMDAFGLDPTQPAPTPFIIDIEENLIHHA